MSTVERKEFQETKIMRTLSPSRNIRNSNQNLAQFDSNLDYLLEDLQNSVSRPGSSLGYREASRSHTLDSNRSNSLNRISNLKSSNPVTEYSSDDAYNYTSPDGRKKVTGYKKETYSYKTSGGRDVGPEKIRTQNSINQLDSLLDDLQQVKKSSYESESYNSSGLSPTFQTAASKRNVNRELHYGDTPRSSSRSRTLERTEREEAVTRDLYSNEGTYGDLRPLRTTSPSPSSRTSTLSKQTKVTNVKDFPLEVVETTIPDIDPDVLAHLDPDLRPPGNTKVTTTIKTYTYEIPGSGSYPTNLDVNTTVDEKYVYSPNESQTTPSKSFVYNKVENKSSENRIYNKEPTWDRKQYKETIVDNRTEKYNNYPAYQKPAPPGGSSVLKETITTRNYQPGYSPEVAPPSEQTYIYNETTTTKNINQNGYPQPPPPPQTTYIINKETNTSTVNRNTPYSERDYPVGNPPGFRKEYIINETHNTTNRTVGPGYQNGYPPNDPNKTVVYKHETHTTNNYGGRPKTPTDVDKFDPKNPPYGRKPNEPVNIHYKYTSTSTTSNNYKGGYPPGDDSQTLLPSRFPTDSEIVDSAPPKRLDDLMATIGNEPPNSPLNAGYTAHEHELAQQKKIDSLKQQHADVEDSQKKEPVARTKNVSGPPVYYPPGQEMFAKREEEAWRAEGGYGKASGKYEYEAKSKSKSKSSSGATVVPVCLPLCCGLPCVLL